MTGNLISAGIPLDSLADILLGRGVAVPSAPRTMDRPPAPLDRASAPAPPPLPGNRLLQVVEEATKRRLDLSQQILGLLQWKEVPEMPWQQREADAISWALRMGTHELFDITDPFGSTALILSCRLGMEQLCNVMLTAPGILPKAGWVCAWFVLGGWKLVGTYTSLFGCPSCRLNLDNII